MVSQKYNAPFVQPGADGAAGLNKGSYGNDV